MASLSVLLRLALTIGAEAIAPDFSKTLTGITEKIADVVRSISGTGTDPVAGSTTILWADSQHATTVNPLISPFTCGVLLVDPDSELSADYPITLELSVTQHNSTNVQNHYFIVSRQVPFCLASSIMAATASLTADSTTGFAGVDGGDANYPRITRIRVHNPHASQAVKVRLLLFK